MITVPASYKTLDTIRLPTADLFVCISPLGVHCCIVHNVEERESEYKVNPRGPHEDVVGHKGIGHKGIDHKGIGHKGIGHKGIGHKGIGLAVLREGGITLSLPGGVPVSYLKSGVEDHHGSGNTLLLFSLETFDEHSALMAIQEYHARSRNDVYQKAIKLSVRLESLLSYLDTCETSLRLEYEGITKVSDDMSILIEDTILCSAHGGKDVDANRDKIQELDAKLVESFAQYEKLCAGIVSKAIDILSPEHDEIAAPRADPPSPSVSAGKQSRAPPPRSKNNAGSK